jgi:predicted small secreted protein
MTKKTFPIQFIMTAIALALFISLTSCNTVNGVGKDLQILGKKMEKSSQNSTNP